MIIIVFTHSKLITEAKRILTDKRMKSNILDLGSIRKNALTSASQLLLVSMQQRIEVSTKH